MRHLVKFVLFIAVAVGLSGPALAAAGRATFAYDALGRLVTVTYDNGKVITYSYDAAGNRTSRVVATGP